METMQTIRTRHSYRSTFKDQPVPRQELQEILEAGVLAPSGCNLQTTRFIGVDDPELVKKLADIYGIKWAQTSRAAILLIGKETMSPSGVSYHIHDYSAAAENICLAAADRGLATVWIEGQIRGDKAAQMGRLLGVPDDMTVYVYLPLGYPAEAVPAAKKEPFESRAWFNHYGA